MASRPQASCLSDPNFAVICAFLERFANHCGITHPTFADLQEMLENSEQVSQELAELHIKLLRKARKTVFIEKWEKALIKFCHTYSSQDGWEIERFGYKKSRLEVKLRALKMLLEGQFDLNIKFKSSINSLESDELRSKPLGKDKSGRVYWLQLDPASNIRVYREDMDEESWVLVAQDRESLVNLLKELSYGEYQLDINLLNGNAVTESDKPLVDTGQGDPNSVKTCETNEFKEKDSTGVMDIENIKCKDTINRNELFNISLGNMINGDISMNEKNYKNGNSDGELNNKPLENCQQSELVRNLADGTITEPVMYIVGEGNGEDCMTGNPDIEDSDKESEKLSTEIIVGPSDQINSSLPNSSDVNNLNSEKMKSTPKLWTIDKICGVSDDKKCDEDISSGEHSDIKSRQKNYSTFSIDSVLEKKEVGSAENSSISQIALNYCDSNEGSICGDAEADISDEIKNIEPLSRGSDSAVVGCLEDSNDVLVSSDNVGKNTEECKMKSLNIFSVASGTVINTETSGRSSIVEEKEDGQLEERLLEAPALQQISKKYDKSEEVDQVEQLQDSESTCITEKEFTKKNSYANVELILHAPASLNLSDKNDKSETEGTMALQECEYNSNPAEKQEENKRNINNSSSEMLVDIVGRKALNEAVEESEKLLEKGNENEIVKLENSSTSEEITKNCIVVSQEETTESVEYVTKDDDGSKETKNEDVTIEKAEEHDKVFDSIVSDIAETPLPEQIKVSDNHTIESEANSKKENYTDNGSSNSEIVETKLSDTAEHSVSSDRIHKKFVEPVNEEISAGLEVNSKDKTAINTCKIQCTVQEQAQPQESLESNFAKTEIQSEVKKEPNLVPDVPCSEDKHLSTSEYHTEADTKKAGQQDIKHEIGGSDDIIKSMESGETFNKVIQSQEIREQHQHGPSRSPLLLTDANNTMCGKNLTVTEKNCPEESINLIKEEPIDVEKMRESQKIEKINRIDEEENVEVNEENENAVDMIEEDDQSESAVVGKVKRKFSRRRRRGRNRWSKVKKGEKIVSEGDIGKEKKISKRKGRPKREDSSARGGGREIKLLGIMPEDTEMPTVRQSRRIAQIKLKEEAERRRVEALQLETFKKKKTGKIKKGKSKKNIDSDSYDEKQDEDVDDSDDGKPKALKEKKSRRKKKDKLVFNELNPWESSSGSSTVDDEEDEIEEEPHEEEELTFKSDHEFSPESDVEDPDYKPMKRARTAKVEESKEEPGKYDDTSCEKCGKNDHPEWILLCDKCDKGWHASCVRPALMIVPEGDWYCPPCEHIALIQKLQESLVQYDRCQKQREIEETRKKRLAFVGISLDNVLPPTKKSSSKNDEDSGDEEDDSGSSSGSGSKSDSESDSEDEPIYQLRQRRSNVTSYRFNEFDELIKSALQDEMEAVRGAGNSGKGKDISNIVNAEKQRRQEEEIDNISDKFTNCDKGAKEAEKTEGDEDGEVETEEIGDGADTAENLSDEILPVVSRSIKKKKSKSVKITSLDFTSEEEDHNSDSDFKGESTEEESEYSFQSESESSNGPRRGRGGDGPIRRSTRARVSRYDRDFINDDSDDAPKRKKSRRDWDSSESSDSDRSWGRKKRKVQKSYGRGSSRRSRGKSKKKKQRRVSFESDEESVTAKKSKNKKIKHVGLESLDEDTVLSRRTRGKKINYQEITGSDSEDNARNQKSRSSRVIESDDDFIAEKEGQDAESEDIDDSLEEEDEGSGNESSNSISVKKQKDTNSELTEGKVMKKKKWVIPDPDDFSENDLMEDEQLDKFTEELEELDEEEEEILGNMLESGDVPINELKAAVKRAKEESKQRKVNVAKNKEREEKESGKTLVAESAGTQAEFAGGKFPKVGKIKITPSRSQLASEVAVALAVPQEAPNAIPAKPTIFNESESSGNPGFLLKTLQGDVKQNIPVANHLPPYPLENTYGTYPGGSVPLNNLMTLVKPEEQLPSSEVSSSIKSGHQISEFGAFQRMVHGHRIASYPPTLPATVPGVSNLDPQTGLGTNQVKRKHDMSSESEGGNTSAAIDERSQSKRQDSPTKKKGRSRGKKQILDDPETQEKLDGLGSAVLPADEGSVITRILNSPQGSQSYPRSDSNQFSVTPRSRPPFPPSISSHFPNQPPRPMASFRMRPPGPPGTMFRTSHPHDPSPSGGGAINIAIANRGMGKPAPGTPLPSFSKVPSLSGFPPRFVTSDPTGRAIYPSVNPGVRPDFPFGNFYGAFPQGAAPGPEGSAFHSGAFQQSFGDETQVGGQINPKQLDDEVGGEFGGLASYFASQREDDLDT